MLNVTDRDVLEVRSPGVDPAFRDAVIVALLRAGMTNDAVARRLHIGLRTAVRWIGDAQTRAGAATRFEWGVAVGRADARRDDGGAS